MKIRMFTVAMLATIGFVTCSSRDNSPTNPTLPILPVTAIGTNPSITTGITVDSNDSNGTNGWVFNGCYTCGQSEFCFWYNYSNGLDTLRYRMRWNGPCGKGARDTVCRNNDTPGQYTCSSKSRGKGPCPGDGCKG